MFDFDFGLGEDIDLLRESVAAFAADRIAPRAAEIDESNEFPRDLWPELGELGLLGITVEEEYGGSTLGYLAHVVAMEEISRASASVGLSYGAHSNLCVNQLRRWGTDEQRQRFLPAIDTLNEYTRVVHMGGDTDYRLRLLREAGTYLTPEDDLAQQKLHAFFGESASSEVREDHALEVNGRDIHVQRCAKGIAWFDFTELCDGPRSQADYIEIARWYPTVILSGVPALDATREDQARRFIALVDEFYDRHVKLIVAADYPADDLYFGNRLRFEFERTVSRLLEMQSAEYLHLPHLP